MEGVDIANVSTPSLHIAIKRVPVGSNEIASRKERKPKHNQSESGLVGASTHSAEIRSVTSSGKARSDSKGTTATGAWSDSGGVVRLGDGVGGGLCLARLHLNGAIGELRYVNGLLA